MKSSRLASLAFLLFVACPGFAQDGQGYVVLNSGDTLRGRLVVVRQVINPTVVDFIGSDGTKSTYRPDDIRAFGHDRGLRYESFLVTHNVSPPATSGMQAGRNNESPIPQLAKDRVFLRILVFGPVTLLEYIDPQSRYNLYLRKQEEPVYLVHHRYYVRKLASVAIVREYLVQLRSLLADCGSLKVPDYLEYNSREISDLIRDYIRCKGGVTREVENPKPRVRLGLTTGVQADLVRTNSISFPVNYGFGLAVLTDFPNHNYRSSGAAELTLRRHQWEDATLIHVGYVFRIRISDMPYYLTAGASLGSGWYNNGDGGVMGIYSNLISGGGIILRPKSRNPVFLDLRFGSAGYSLYETRPWGIGFAATVPVF